MDENVMKKVNEIVNLDFVKKVMEKSENDPSIEVSDFFIKRATNKGDNYTSDMFRIIVEYRKKDGNKSVELSKPFIVKFEPIAEGIHREMITKTSLFETEINMMTNTLEKMNNLLGPNHQLNGRGLHVSRKNPTLLVIEDLAPLGYRMADRIAGLDIEHCLLAIRGLARFHASSVALCEKEPEIRKLHHKGMFHPDQPAEMAMFFSTGTKQLAEEVAKWPEADPSYSKKIMEVADKMYEKGCEVSKPDENEFNVLNHGDFWVNNMLFKYNEHGRPIKHIFVDFQLCFYSSPAIDLQYFFNTSMTDDMLTENEELLLEEYRRTLSSTMARLGCRTMPPTIGTLKAMMLKRAFYGLISTFSILPILLVDKKEAKGLDEMMSEDGTLNNVGYSTPLYRKALTRRLPKFNDLGLFD